MGAAIPDEKSRTGHSCCEADGGNQGRLMNVFFYDVAEKCSRHTEEKDGKTEGPFRSTLGETDVVGNFLAEDGPAINSTDAAVK